MKAIEAGFSAGISLEGWDDIYAFFINAYHVGDWMIADGFIEESHWDSYVKSTPDLALCRDFCNGVKHRQLRKYSDDDRSLWTCREFVPPNGERWSVRVEPERSFWLLDEVVDRVVQHLHDLRDGRARLAR
jgi:hypothetical protein